MLKKPTPLRPDGRKVDPIWVWPLINLDMEKREIFSDP